jgi:hypothetical protein
MKIFRVFLSLAVLLAASGCAISSASPAAATAPAQTEAPAVSPNASPLPAEPAGQARASTAEEIQNTLGISFHLPEGAQDVECAIVEREGSRGVAQAKFTLDGVKYWLRTGSEAEYRDISGVEAEWAAVKSVQVSYCDGELRMNEGGQGVCLWFDVVPGLMYSLYTDTGASEEGILQVAGEVFVPMQEE